MANLSTASSLYSTPSPPTPFTSESASSTQPFYKPPKSDSANVPHPSSNIVGRIWAAFLGLIGLLAIICLRKDDCGTQDEECSDSAGNVPLAPLATTVNPRGNGDTVLKHALPEPTSDTEIIGMLSKLDNSIEQHVSNSQVFSKDIECDEKTIITSISNSGTRENPKLAHSQLATLLSRPSSRENAIQYFIGWVILSNMDYRSPTKASLLPVGVWSLLEGFPPIENDYFSQDAFNTAFTKLRLIIVYLLRSKRSNRAAFIPGQYQLQPAISKNIAMINTVLDHFLLPDEKSKNRHDKNLEEIIVRGGNLSMLLFGQEATFFADWKPRTAGKGQGLEGCKLAVFPRLFMVYPDKMRCLESDISSGFLEL